MKPSLEDATAPDDRPTEPASFQIRLANETSAQIVAALEDAPDLAGIMAETRELSAGPAGPCLRDDLLRAAHVAARCVRAMLGDPDAPMDFTAAAALLSAAAAAVAAARDVGEATREPRARCQDRDRAPGERPTD